MSLLSQASRGSHPGRADQRDASPSPIRRVPAKLLTTASAVVELFGVLAQQLSAGPGSDVLVVPRTDLPGFVARNRYLVVRPLGSDDSAMLRQFLTVGLSEQSRQLRFLSAGFRVSDTVVEYLADRDGRDRVALAAFVCDADGQLTEIAGVVEYALPPRTGDTAQSGVIPEVALAVADFWQGAGVGSRLLSMLSVLSIAGGYDQWSASVVVDNDASFATLRRVGQVLVVSESAGVADVVVELTHPA